MKSMTVNKVRFARMNDRSTDVGAREDGYAAACTAPTSARVSVLASAARNVHAQKATRTLTTIAG